MTLYYRPLTSHANLTTLERYEKVGKIVDGDLLKRFWKKEKGAETNGKGIQRDRKGSNIPP